MPSPNRSYDHISGEFTHFLSLSLSLSLIHSFIHYSALRQLYSSMTAALEGGEWSAARPDRTLPRERHGTHFTEG